MPGYEGHENPPLQVAPFLGYRVFGPIPPALSSTAAPVALQLRAQLCDLCSQFVDRGL